MSPRATRRQWYTIADVAGYFKVNPQRVYEWIYAGHLISTRLPGRGNRPGPHRISEDAIAAFAERHETAKAAS